MHHNKYVFLLGMPLHGLANIFLFRPGIFLQNTRLIMTFYTESSYPGMKITKHRENYAGQNFMFGL